MVECTVVLPLFFFLLFALLDACRYVAQQAAVDYAVRQAGEFASKLTAHDCITPARARFDSLVTHTPFEAPITFDATIVTSPDGTRSVQVVARTHGSKLFSLGSNVLSAATYALEYQSACDAG